MAFSYSDKNFTVVGNLCFVHIYTDKTGYSKISIPPALKARMLLDVFSCSFVSITIDDLGRFSSTCIVKDGFVEFTNTKGTAYINFSFPIDSNK